MTPSSISRRAVLVVVVLAAVLGLLAAFFLGRPDTADRTASPDPSASTTAAPGADPASSPSTSSTVPDAPVAPEPEPVVDPATVAPQPVADTAVDLTPEPTGPAPVEPGVEATIASDGEAPVLVGLDVPEGLTPEEREPLVAAAAAEVLASVPPGSASRVKPTGTTAVLALTVDAAGLDALRRAAAVVGVGEDGINTIESTNSPVSVQADELWSQDLDGAGQVVAVLDTGVARDHPYLATDGVSDVLAEACFSTTSASRYTSNCPGGEAQAFGVGVAAPCPAPASACHHGTHVAGIVAGGSGAASMAPASFGASGIAPGAKLLAVQVFSSFGSGAEPSSQGAFDSDIIRALEWVYGQRATHPGLAAVNLSLGGGRYAGTCDADYPEMKQAIDDLRAAGIATVVAAGNSGWRGTISGPACISTAVAVGWVDDATLAVSNGSNLSPAIDLLAPGSAIRSSFPPDVMGNLSGTSMAAPAAAAAFATMKQAAPQLGVDDILSALQAYGRSIATGLGSCPTTLPYLQMGATRADLRSLADASFTGISPVRVRDTRFGIGGSGGLGARLGQGQCLSVSATSAGVPADAVAVVANVTAVEPTADTYVTAFPQAGPPNASNLNVPVGRIKANLVTVGLDAQRRFQLFNFAGNVHVVVDVVGWYRPAAGAEFQPSAPIRVLDTSFGPGSIGLMGPGESRVVDATRAGVPPGAAAVLANITATGATTSSWFTAYPSGAVPNTSNVNFAPGQTVANLAIVKLAPDGTFRVFNNDGSARLVVDVTGWFDDTATGVFTPVAPTRLVDTRSSSKLGAGQVGTVQTSFAGVPPSATAVVVNVTATQPTASSWLTLYPGGVAPTASSVNFDAGQTVPNLVTVQLAPDGTFAVRNQFGSTHLILDVAGYYE